MNGQECAQKIRAWEEQKQLQRSRIIAISGNTLNDAETTLCLQAGFDDILTKPVSATKLQEVLTRNVPQPQSRDT